MTSAHEALGSMLAAGEFEPYIRHIRFPHFRNIREDTRIDFDHPITALVGANGTNKTAILRALQGCPDYYNVGQYWFSTSLDPIDPAERHRFIHGYVAPSDGQIVEVMKTRIERKENPDYFEPTRPLLKDGMQRIPPLGPGESQPERTQTRWKAINKNVLYLDFRSELSAFDKSFFHSPLRKSQSSIAHRKNFIRKRTPYLLDAIENKTASHTWYSNERIVEAVSDVTTYEIGQISRIIGRDYRRARIIAHRYFNVEGKSVVLTGATHKYSEAFAGSGEFAVVMLVTSIVRAPERSLILLDEPEVSLHPGAQQKLMLFLTEQSKLKRHQFVISTHSPELVRSLPPAAIKVFFASEDDGRIELLAQESNPSEAFFRLGSDLGQTLSIYVEDALAALLVKRALRPLGPADNARLRIDPIPGGAATILTKFISGFALTGNRTSLVLLDGDQEPEHRPVPAATPDAELVEAVNLYAKGNVQLSLNGHKGDVSPSDRTDQYRKVLAWFHDHVDYLPGDNPDELVLTLTHSSGTPGSNAKLVWRELANKSLGRADWERNELTSAEILAEQARAIAQISDDEPALVKIRERVKRFLCQHPM
jgi:predicted ATPase